MILVSLFERRFLTVQSGHRDFGSDSCFPYGGRTGSLVSVFRAKNAEKSTI
jgi:hypothetical protein